MRIKSITGQTIIITDHKTMRGTLEHCALEGVDLSGADLRGARLSHANLDGMIAIGASFWGCDLTGSDIGFADLRGSDLRGACLKDACLAETDLTGADLQGAYFSGTIFEGSRLSGALLSCPSFWGSDFHLAGSIEGLTYNHLGERRIVLRKMPLVINGLERRLVLAEGYCLWGNELYAPGCWKPQAENAMFQARTLLDRARIGLQNGVLRPAKNLSRR